MHSSGFLRNTWYVAARSADIGQSLTAHKFLDLPVVLYRGPDGTPYALEDACPHRKLPLSKGNLKGAAVECGYHGLTFDGSGTCIAAPTQGDPIPRRARVRSYPVLDRYGFLWIWVGDAPADERALFDIPHFEDPAWGRTPAGALEIACHYLWVTDNLLDPSHVAWVHVTSFAGAGTDDRPMEIEETPEGVIVSRWICGEPAPPYYRPMLTFGDNCDRKQHYECRLPSIAINGSVYTRAGTGGPGKPLPDDAFLNNSYNFITPVDRDQSLYFWFQHRNSDPENAELSERMFEGAKMAFNEDKAVLEAVHVGMKDPRTPYLNLGLDAGAMRFRAKLEKRIKSEVSSAEA